MNRTALIACCALIGAGAWWWHHRSSQYVVVRGDTLFEIARDHGVTVEDLRSWNGLKGDLIEVGQVLSIHVPEADEAETRTSTGGRKRTTRVPGRVQSRQTTSDRPPLVRPSPKPCLKGPALEDDPDAPEPMYAASAGLETQQVADALRAHDAQLFRCVGDGAFPQGTVTAELTVACSGVVDRVEILDSDGLDEQLVACVQSTLAYAEFPAHDLPDGFAFVYPLNFDP